MCPWLILLADQEALNPGFMNKKGITFSVSLQLRRIPYSLLQSAHPWRAIGMQFLSVP